MDNMFSVDLTYGEQQFTVQVDYETFQLLSSGKLKN